MGYNFDLMSREELIKVLKRHYSKCIKNLDDNNFTEGNYYEAIQTGSNQVWFYNDDCQGVCFEDFDEARKYFEG